MAVLEGSLTSADGASVSATFDDVLRTLTWANTGKIDALVVIRAEGRPVLRFTCRAGRSGVVRNVSSDYSAETTEVELRGRG